MELEAGRRAFQAGLYAESERRFLLALRTGADEVACRLYLARVYNHLRNWSGALEQWMWLRNKDATQLEPQLQVARALMRLGQHSDSAVEFRRLLQRMPDHAEARHQLAQLELELAKAAFRIKDYKQSKLLFLRALDAGSGQAICHQHLARIYNSEHSWDQALEQWEWLRDRNDSELEPQLQVARARLRLGQQQEAAVEFRRVLQIAPDNSEAQQYLARIELDLAKAAFKLNDYRRSEAGFLAALAAGSDAALCHQHLARIYNSERNWAKALEQWEWLRNDDPAGVEPQLQVARAMLRLGQYVDAVVEFKRVLELVPDHVEAQQRLFQIEDLKQEEAAELAIESLRQAAEAVPTEPGNLLRLGQSLAGLGRHSEAIDAFRRCILLDVDQPNAQLGLGRSLRALRQMQDAREAFSRSIELSPEDSSSLHELGRTLADLGRSKEAAVVLRRAVALAPSDPDIHYDLAKMLRALRELPEATDVMARATELAPRHAAAHYELGNMQAMLGRHQQALNSFRHVSECNPLYPNLDYCVGRSLQALRRTAEAAAAFAVAAARAPGSARAHHNLGRSLRDLGRHDEALVALERAASLDADNEDIQSDLLTALLAVTRGGETVELATQLAARLPNVGGFFHLGQALAAGGVHEEAVQAFRKAFRAQPDRREICHALGKSLLALKRAEEAVEVLERAVELGRNHAGVHYDLGRALIGLERFGEAEAVFRRAAELGAAPSILRGLGAVLLTLGQVEDAKLQFLRAVQRNRGLISVDFQIGLAHREAGRIGEAVAVFEHVIDADPQQVPALLELGHLYLQQRRNVEARSIFEKVIALDGPKVAAHYGLGIVYRRTGAFDAARTSFETVLGHNPQHEGCLLQLGELAELAGDGITALKYANVNLTLRPASVNAMILRARVHLANGHTQDALVDLQQALRLAPSHPRAELYLSLVRRLGVTDDGRRKISLCIFRPLGPDDLELAKSLQEAVEEIIVPSEFVSDPFEQMSKLRKVEGGWQACIAASSSDWLLAVGSELPVLESVEMLRNRAGAGVGIVTAVDRSIADRPSLFWTAALKGCLGLSNAPSAWPDFADAVGTRLRRRMVSSERANLGARAAVRGAAAWLITPHGKNLFGGGEQFLRTLVPIYRALGYEPMIVGLLDQVDDSDSEGRVGDLRYLHLHRSISAVRHALLERSPGVVHVLSGVGYEVAEAVEGLNTCMVYGTHFWRDMFHGPFENVDRTGRPRTEFGRLIPAMDQGYANSVYTRDMIERHFGVTQPIVYSLPFDLPETHATYGTGRYALLLNGRPDKGLPLILEVAQRLRDVPFRVVASQMPRELVEAEIRKANIDNVDIVNWTQDTASLYRDARVVLVPSYSFVETFSRVVIEAQRFGVPVVGSDRGNVPLLLQQSGTALPEIADLWADEIKRLFEDDVYHRERALEARKNADSYRFEDQPARLTRLVHSATRRVGVAVGAGIGNMIQCAPAIRRLSEHLGHPVDIVVNSDFSGVNCLFAGAPWVGSVFTSNANTASVRFETLFVFDSFGPLLPAFNVDQLAVSRRTFSFEMTRTMHESEFNLVALRDILGIPYDSTDVPKYFLGDFRYAPNRGKRIGLHGGSKDGAWIAKRWPYFAELAERLSALGYDVVSFGSPAEYVPGTIDETGTPLRTTIENMCRCRYFVSNDSGLMHVADALGIPLTVLFAPSSIVKNGPLAPSSQVIGIEKGCSPCQFDPEMLAGCRCIAEIPLSDVLGKVVSHLEETDEGRRRSK